VTKEGYKGTMDMSKSHPEAVKKVEKKIEDYAKKHPRVPGGKMGVKEEVISERQKDSDNQRLSQERGRSNYGKASVRNMRAFGKGGNAADPAERLVAIDARHKAHKEKRGVKTKGMKEEVVTELNRFEKEKGTDTKTGKPIQKGGSAKKDLAFQAVMKKYSNQRMGGNEPKKVRGAKSDEGTGRITRMVAKKKEQQAKSKALDAKAKKAGYKSTQDYVNVQAVRKGGLGT